MDGIKDNFVDDESLPDKNALIQNDNASSHVSGDRLENDNNQLTSGIALFLLHHLLELKNLHRCHNNCNTGNDPGGMMAHACMDATMRSTMCRLRSMCTHHHEMAVAVAAIAVIHPRQCLPQPPPQQQHHLSKKMRYQN